MKGKGIKILCIAFVLLFIFGVVGFYFYEVICLNIPYTKHLPRFAAIILAAVGTLLKLISGGGRKSLAVYEKAYATEIGSAFQHEPRLRKKLLCACRLYDESNYKKALKTLHALLREAEFSADKIPVLLFIALCCTDAGLRSDAIKAYCDLLRIAPGNAQAHSNLGILYVKEGLFEAALTHYNRAIELKPDNYYAYINRANYYFRELEYDLAVEDAQKALQFKNNGYDAASLLAIIYALQEDTEKQKKYFHLAITSGKNAQDLKAAIRHYKNELSLESQNA